MLGVQTLCRHVKASFPGSTLQPFPPPPPPPPCISYCKRQKLGWRPGNEAEDLFLSPPASREPSGRGRQHQHCRWQQLGCGRGTGPVPHGTGTLLPSRFHLDGRPGTGPRQSRLVLLVPHEPLHLEAGARRRQEGPLNCRIGGGW